MGGKVLARAFSVYTRWCWVHVWVESWVVQFWHKCSVFTLVGVGYKFGGKVLVQVISVYTGLCWVQVWVES